MPETLEQRIIRHEGIKLRLYTDSLGYLTIGCGRAIGENGINEPEAMLMLSNDIEKASSNVVLAFPWSVDLSPLRQEVLTEMAFQLGIDGLSKFVNMLAELKGGNYQEASSQMLNSEWAMQTPQRAQELASLMIQG